MMDGISIMQRVAARGATIRVLDKPHFDLTSKIGQGILAFLSALAMTKGNASPDAPPKAERPPRRKGW